MNKAIDALIPDAYDVLEKVKIAKGGVVDKAWRGQISTFGSVIKNGSLLAAVAFFSAQGGSDVPRERLMMAIWLLLHKGEELNISFEQKNEEEKRAYKAAAKKLFDYVAMHSNDRSLKENIINQAVALKLAMNLYYLKKKSAVRFSGEGSFT